MECRYILSALGVPSCAPTLDALLAGVHIKHTCTLLAAHVAAPVEDAATLLTAPLRACIVATATAQQVTAVDARGAHIAGTTACAKRAGVGVGLTEVG